MELLWERMSGGIVVEPRKTKGANGSNGNGSNGHGGNGHSTIQRPPRLPGDTRCIARCKSGQRCRGRIRGQSDYCFFHDPAITPEQRRAMVGSAAGSRRPRVQLPPGYPRRLNSRRAVQRAMDQLYGEIRTGVVDAQRGRALFDILCLLARIHGGIAGERNRQHEKELAAAIEALDAQRA